MVLGENILGIKCRNVVLASSNEEKVKKLEQAGIPCFCFPPLVKENAIVFDPEITGREMALKFSEMCAADVGNVYPNFYIISTEQSIECDGKVFKRPDCLDDVLSDLKQLNGKKYTLYTATTIYKNFKKRWQELEETHLTRKLLTPEEIEAFAMEYGPSMFGVLGSVRLDEFPDIVEEKNINPEIIDALPVKKIVHFFKMLRK